MLNSHPARGAAGRLGGGGFPCTYLLSWEQAAISLYIRLSRVCSVVEPFVPYLEFSLQGKKFPFLYLFK